MPVALEGTTKVRARLSVWGLVDKTTVLDENCQADFGYVVCPNAVSPPKFERYQPQELDLGRESLTFLGVDNQIYTIGWLKGLSSGCVGLTPVVAPNASRFVQVVSGARHILALDEDGEAFIWSWDKLYPGQQLIFNFPTGNYGRRPVLKLAAGTDLSAAIIEGLGVAFWWQSQIEHNKSNPLPVPYKLIPNTEIFPDHNDRIVDLAVGSEYIVFINVQGSLFITNISENGYTTLPDHNKRFEELRLGKYVAVFAFYDRLAAITDSGGLVLGQWNRNKFEVFKVNSLSHVNVVSVALGHFHTLAMTKTGDVYTWGQDLHQQGVLGTGILSNDVQEILASHPHKLELGGRAIRIAAEEYRSATLVVSGLPSSAL